jgi:uncharacterized protein
MGGEEMPGDEKPITVRRLPLVFPSDIDPMLMKGQPEESYTIVGLSLLLPYLEPYLIRSMRAAKPKVTDPKIAEDLALFNGQEGQHYRQHIRFNEAIRMNGFEHLKELETELSDDYRRYSDKRSLRFNLAYAEGFEAYTLALARFTFVAGTLDRLPPSVRDLFRWHLVEEIEHRTVAFDVYKHVCGGYFYRLFVGLFAQIHLNQFILRVAFRMLRTNPKEFRKQYGGVVRGLIRLAPLSWKVTWWLAPRILATYLPWYNPHRIKMPPEAISAAAEYTAMAAKAQIPPIGAEA